MKTPKNTLNDNSLQSDAEPCFMEQLQVLINQQITQKEHQLAVKHIAESLRISKKTLERKIKIHTQQTAKEYLHELRLQYAHQALEEQSYSTAHELAFSFGYSNPSHFTVIFKKRFGYTPKDLLLKIKEEKLQIRNVKNVIKK